MQKEFNVSDERMGALTYAFFITYMIAAPLTGWLGDRFPRKPLIVAGALIWSIATLLTARVHNYEMLYFRHAVVGIGEATFSIFAPALLADFYPEIDRNKILSIFYTAIPVGAALGYLTGGMLGPRYGWRAPFFIAALPGVLIAICFWFFVREPSAWCSGQSCAEPESIDISRNFSQSGVLDGNAGHGDDGVLDGRHFRLAADIFLSLWWVFAADVEPVDWRPLRWWMGLRGHGRGDGWRSDG